MTSNYKQALISSTDKLQDETWSNTPQSAKAFYAWNLFCTTNQNIILCYANEEEALLSYKQLLLYSNNNINTILHLPAIDTNPYDRTSPSANNLSSRVEVFSKLANEHSNKIVVTTAKNLLTKIPPIKTFHNSVLTINTGDQYDIKYITESLINKGFTRMASAVDSSEFAVRGEILDLVTVNNSGYRINFGWDKIDNIRQYDTYSQLSSSSIDSVTISSAHETLLNEQTIDQFKKSFLGIFGANHINSKLYQSVINGTKCHGYEHLTPLFYKEMTTLINYLGNPKIIYDNYCLQSMIEHESSYHEVYKARLLENKADLESFYYAIEPELLIKPYEKIKQLLANEHFCFDKLNTSEALPKAPNIASIAQMQQKTEVSILSDILSENRSLIPIIFCNSKISRDRIASLLTNYDLTPYNITKFNEARKHLISLVTCPLEHGFFSKKHLFISEQDLLGNKFAPKKISSKKKLINLLTELDNISEGELIVHKEHGIGRFEKIETMKVENIEHDCLKIIYANNDILYLPVENIDQFKKYGGDETPLDKLGHIGWQKRKAKLKNRIRDIAKQLIEITAKRELTRVSEIYFETHSYNKFCKEFPYSETKDQLSAIDDIKSDLLSGRLMDRLICGDVGFGKTEVAMRAAFMITHDTHEDKPQIAIISPTTILCKQHYKNFTSRFKGTQVGVAQLSRLVKPAEIRKNKAALENGDVQIITGTHALLASNIKFKNLKMVIIDEEQHFGVVQKEKLKQLKAGIHVLSLSATPIPRTLQMSMVGIKDLSLISTPPVDRLPVRTNITPYDSIIIRDALIRERSRGGLSFYVAPRIQDLDWISQELDKIVPELNYKIAHGQMKPADIDQIMNEFCDGKFDILLSTTIIESGIDIPVANTMIIHRADMLGLSQLYQLRGRVGRSKARGYAYLTLNQRRTNKHSLQRLEVLRNLDTLGAGFSIASHDMDLRGFGNLVGDEQSGHIREVGSELYQEMLDQAITELKNTTDKTIEFTPKINLKIPVLIPEKYIEDSALRLAIYRRAGHLSNEDEMHNFSIEMEDRFGPIPLEFANLLKTVEIRNKCLELKIESLDSGDGGFVARFNNNFDVSDKVMKFIAHHPRHAKIKPDNKLVFIKQLTKANLIQEAFKFLAKLY